MESMEENIRKIRERLSKEGYPPKTPIEQTINTSRSKDAQEICNILLGKTPQDVVRLNHIFKGNSRLLGDPFYGSFSSKEDMDAALIKIANICGRKVFVGTPVPELD